MRAECFTVDEFERMVRAGEIKDAPSACCIWAASAPPIAGPGAGNQGLR